MVRILGIAFGLVVAAAAGWVLRGWFTGTPAASAENALICKVARGRLEQNVKAAVGYIKPAPNALVRLGFAASKDLPRAIVKLHVQEGDSVSPGALLAELDHEDLTVSRGQLTAELHVSQSRLETLKKLEPLEIRHAEAVLAERATQRDVAQRGHQRKQALLKDKLVSAADVEDAAQESAAAQARYNQAETALQQVRVKFGTDSATLNKQIAQTNTALQALDTQMRWRELRSPLTVSAQVFAVHQRQGELAGQANQPVLTLLDPNQLQAHLYIAEADLGRIPMDPPPNVTLRATALAGQVLRGRIIKSLPQPVIQDNVVYYLAVVEVAAEQRALLRMDMSVTAHIKAGVKENALWLPLAAVRSRADGWYVLQRGLAGLAETPVRIGWQDQGRVEILEGLAEGDEVISGP